MPHTKHPLDYPINRLFLLVGMALKTWIRYERAADAAGRRALEREIDTRLGLTRAVETGLLKWFKFRWTYRKGYSFIRTIRLVPTDAHRTCPGIARLKRLFFDPRGPEDFFRGSGGIGA